jgi:hypothetical protein
MKTKTAFLFIFIGSLFSCKHDNISDKLIIEQSEDLTLAFGRELWGMQSEVQVAQIRGCEINDEAKESESLIADYQTFLEKMEKASRTEISEIIKIESKKLKQRTAYRMNYFKFKQININGLEGLSDKAFKCYAKSRIAEKYWECTGTVMFRLFRKCRLFDNNNGL